MCETIEGTDFDPYTEDYDRILNEGLAVSGENREFFAIGRIAWLAKRLAQLPCAPKTVVDYGCGTGDSAPHLLEILGAESVVGIDISPKSLEVARQRYTTPACKFFSPDEYVPQGSIDVVYCNGVLHHVDRPGRLRIARYIAACLRPRGVVSLWENNPWNPATRYIMSRVPFDREAVMLTGRETRRLMRSVGLRVLRTDYCFFFPRFLKAFRRLEPYLSGLPLGAQYHVLCRKPERVETG